MLSEKERNEIIQDALSVQRGEDFRKIKEGAPLVSLDAYARFLTEIQKVFSSLDPTFQKPKTRINFL